MNVKLWATYLSRCLLRPALKIVPRLPPLGALLIESGGVGGLFGGAVAAAGELQCERCYKAHADEFSHGELFQGDWFAAAAGADRCPGVGLNLAGDHGHVAIAE